MARKARLVLYDFDDVDELDKQLGRSMAEGIRVFGEGKTITVVNIPDLFIRTMGEWAAETAERIYVGNAAMSNPEGR